MNKREDNDAKANERNCREFLKYINNGNGEKAYELLRGNSKLIDELRFGDIGLCYEEIRRSGGERQALYFYARCVKHARNIFEKEIPLISNLQDGGDYLRLERFLRRIGDNHKNMLDEMGDEQDEATE